MLVFCLHDCIVGLHNQMPWEGETTIMTDHLHIHDSSADDLIEGVGSVVDWLRGHVHIAEIAMGCGRCESPPWPKVIRRLPE